MKISRFSDRQKTYTFVILTVTAIVATCLGMDFSQQQYQSEPRMDPTPSSPATYQNTPDVIAAVSAEIPDSASKKISIPDKAISATKVVATQGGWTVGDVKAATPSIPLNERVAQYDIVKVDRPETYPAEGQTLSLPMLNGKNVVVNVQSTSTLQNGDYTWSGHVDGFGDDYPVVMTYGEHSIFATITTPEGAYTMESVDGAGWLYKNPSEFELSNPGFKDYLEVTDI